MEWRNLLEEQIVSMKERIRQMEKNWQPLWLGYDKREDLGNGKYFEKVFLDEAFLETAIVNNAKKELTEGVGSMLGISVNITKWNAEKNATGCAGKENGLYIVKENFSDKENAEQGYAVCEENGVLVLRAMSDAGMLYGVFEILRRIAMEQKLENINKVCVPDMPLRMFNHWDNIDGSIERGYSGYSFFFAGEEVLVDENAQPNEPGISQTDINKFNSQFEFYISNEASGKSVKTLLDIVKNHLKSYEISENAIKENKEDKKINIKLNIEKDVINENGIIEINEKIEENSKYKIIISYKDGNGIIDYITVSEI